VVATNMDWRRSLMMGRLADLLTGGSLTAPNRSNLIKLPIRLATTLREAGVAVAFQSLRQERRGNIKSGVVRLGAGAMASWLAPGDEMIFYEINPMVERIARDHFTFLSQSQGDCKVVLGDGRIQLQRELEQFGPKGFDLLFM